jgi:hypothetical protein
LEPDEIDAISKIFNSNKDPITARASFDSYKAKILKKFNDTEEYAKNYYNISRNLVNNEKFQ